MTFPAGSQSIRRARISYARHIVDETRAAMIGIIASFGLRRSLSDAFTPLREAAVIGFGAVLCPRVAYAHTDGRVIEAEAVAGSWLINERVALAAAID